MVGGFMNIVAVALTKLKTRVCWCGGSLPSERARAHSEQAHKPSEHHCITKHRHITAHHYLHTVILFKLSNHS